MGPNDKSGMDDSRLGSKVRMGKVSGILLKIEWELNQFWVNDQRFSGGQWRLLKFTGPADKGLFVARSGRVSMVVTAAEYEILIRAGAAHGN